MPILGISINTKAAIAEQIYQGPNASSLCQFHNDPHLRSFGPASIVFDDIWHTVMIPIGTATASGRRGSRALLFARIDSSLDHQSLQERDFLLYIIDVVIGSIQVDNFERHNMPSSYVFALVDRSVCSLSDDIEFLIVQCE